MVARVASGRPEQLRVPGLDEEQASRGASDAACGIRALRERRCASSVLSLAHARVRRAYAPRSLHRAAWRFCYSSGAGVSGSDRRDARSCAKEASGLVVSVEQATRLVKDAGSAVRSFDGDRVMGVSIGGSKNTAAGAVRTRNERCGLAGRRHCRPPWDALRRRQEYPGSRSPTSANRGLVIRWLHVRTLPGP